MTIENYFKKGQKAFDAGKKLLEKGDLDLAESSFEKASGFLEAHHSIERKPKNVKLGEEARGWIHFIKGTKSMEFAREAEELGELKVASNSFRKAYNQFFEAEEMFKAISKDVEGNRSRGFMNLVNGLSYSSEGDLAFDNDEYTKSVEYYQKGLSFLNRALKIFEEIKDKEMVAQLKEWISQTNADIWISEGHYNIMMSNLTGEDELLSKSEYERMAAENFRKAVDFLKEIGDDALLQKAAPSIDYSEALHQISLARHQTLLAESRLDEQDHHAAVLFFDKSLENLDKGKALYAKLKGTMPDESINHHLEQIESMEKFNSGMRCFSLGQYSLWQGEVDEAVNAFSDSASHFEDLGMLDQKYRSLKFKVLAPFVKDGGDENAALVSQGLACMQAGHIRMDMGRNAEREAEEDWSEADIFKSLDEGAMSKVKNGNRENTDYKSLSRENREKSAMGFDFAKNLYRKALREFSDAERIFMNRNEEFLEKAKVDKASSQALAFLAQGKYYRKRAEMTGGEESLESRSFIDKAHEMVMDAKAEIEGLDTPVLEKVKMEEETIEFIRNSLLANHAFNVAENYEKEGEYEKGAEKYQEAAQFAEKTVELLKKSGPQLEDFIKTIETHAILYSAYGKQALGFHYELQASEHHDAGEMALEVKFLRKAADEYKKAADEITRAANVSNSDELSSFADEVYEKYLKAKNRINLLEGRTGVY